MTDLTPARWTPRLTTRALGRGSVCMEHTLTSTNTVLKEMARGGAPHGSVCLCETQTAGRGRLDRQWHSPAGQGLWMSVLLRPALAPEKAPLITFAAALAMQKAVQTVTGLDARIKWPNDLVLEGKKLCGILLEMGFGAEGMYVIVGTGLNVGTEAYPADLKGQATSIAEYGDAPERGDLIAAYLAALEEAVDALEHQGLMGIMADYRAGSVTLGSQVYVIGAEHFAGTAEDIDETGALLVRTPQGEMRRVLAGDVSVRGVMGYV